MIEVPSILMVAPRGMVKDDIFLDTPTFLDRVSIDSGIVAFDVAVENAKAITGKNFLINFRGFSPVNIFSKIWYTPKHWIASASNTPIIYFASGTNALNPMFANVRLIRQKTPIGASAMIIIVISIMISLNWLKKFATVSARSPNFARITPMINANTMICSISPLARELIGLSGIIFNNVSVNEVAFIVSTDAALVLIVLMSSPTPGLIRFPTDNATVTASAVVAR